MLLLIIAVLVGINAAANVLMLVITVRMVRNLQKVGVPTVTANAPCGVAYMDQKHESRIASELEIED
jgi:hypothetical protein